MTDLLEISDVVVRFEQASNGVIVRRPVLLEEARNRLRATRQWRALWVLNTLPVRDGGFLDETGVDRILQHSHLELQRLHEEFLMGEQASRVLAPLVQTLSSSKGGAPVRIVDIGCGPGFVLRWLAHRKPFGAHAVDLVGVDFNEPLIRLGAELARKENLSCSFVHANAFDLETPADIYMSTGVLHHFRGDALTSFFERQAGAAMLHFDIKPSPIAPIGSLIFHEARMREPLARYDGYMSAARAHSEETLVSALEPSQGSNDIAVLDGSAGLLRLTRIMHAVLSIPKAHSGTFLRNAPSLHKRLRWISGSSS